MIYGIGERSAQCKELLDRCTREEITGICTFEVVNEATHKFMLAEAFAKRLIAAPAFRELRQRPGVIPSLDDYWKNTERVLGLRMLLLPLTEEILLSAQQERVASGLFTNDSMIVAAMRLYGVPYLATADRDFDGVDGITVFSPSDLPS